MRVVYRIHNPYSRNKSLPFATRHEGGLYEYGSRKNAISKIPSIIVKIKKPINYQAQVFTTSKINQLFGSMNKQTQLNHNRYDKYLAANILGKMNIARILTIANSTNAMRVE